VAAIAFAFALINIKDYFWYKEGVSLTIDDRHKPGLYRNMRSLITADKSPLALIGATGAVALGVTLLELPCTSGMPVMWTNLLSANNVAGGQFVLLLALYMFIFLIDEMALFLAAVFTMKAVKFEEKHGRILKLAGGIVMLALAAVMVIEPTLMNDVGASALVFAGALGVTALILFVHRRVMPALGVAIGSELKPR
jgi:cytochrome c biogenesis protein CcdA